MLSPWSPFPVRDCGMLLLCFGYSDKPTSQVLLQCVVLGAWPKPQCHRTPQPFAAETPVLGLGEFCERLPRGTGDTVDVHVEPPGEFVGPRFAGDQRVGLVGGFKPGPREALMAAVPKQGLIVGLGILRDTVRSRFVRLDRTGRRHVAIEPHACDALWGTRVVARA